MVEKKKKEVKKVEKPTRKPIPRNAKKKSIDLYSPGTAETDALKSPVKAKSPQSPKRAAAKDGKKKSRTSYRAMIKRAIKDLRPNEKTGVSSIAIGKYIEANYNVSDRYRFYLRLALKEGVASKKLVQIRASYRLSAKEERGRSRTKSTRGASKSPSKSPRKKSPSKSPKKEKKQTKEKKPVKEKKKRAASKSPSKKEKAASPKKRGKKAVGKRVTTSEEGGDSAESVPRPAGLKSDYVWQYWDNKWCNYSNEASDIVEEVYQGYLANRGDTDVRSVHSGQWEYQVDFMAMKQTNIQHPNHTVRNIRRMPVSK